MSDKEKNKKGLKANQEYRLTEVEKESELRDQVGFLLSSAKAYDLGQTSESKRLALQLRILLIDSLLDKMHIRSKMPYYDTAIKYRPGNIVAHYGLVILRPREVLPSFDLKTREPQFLSWEKWSKDVVLSNGDGGNFTRWELIKVVSNKRGAHVDFYLPKLYARTVNPESSDHHSKENVLVIGFGPPKKKELPEGAVLLPEPVAPTLRQIAHEVLVSFAKFKPEVFSCQSEVKTLLEPKHSPPGVMGGSIFVDRSSSFAQSGHQYEIHLKTDVIKTMDGRPLCENLLK